MRGVGANAVCVSHLLCNPGQDALKPQRELRGLNPNDVITSKPRAIGLESESIWRMQLDMINSVLPGRILSD